MNTEKYSSYAIYLEADRLADVAYAAYLEAADAADRAYDVFVGEKQDVPVDACWL